MLTKQPVTLNFSQGVNQKIDPNQVPFGQFLALQNAIFTKNGLLSKRNGFGPLTSLPDNTTTNAATFKDTLLGIGTNLRALSDDTTKWYNKGAIQPVALSVDPIVRSASGQTTADTAIAPNDLTVSCWLDKDTYPYYQVVDPSRGAVLVSATRLTNSIASSSPPKAYTLGQYIIIVYLTTGNKLSYTAIPIYAPETPVAVTNLLTSTSGSTAIYEGIVTNNNLVLACTDTGNAINLTYIDSNLVQHLVVPVSSLPCTYLSLTTDTSQPNPPIYIVVDNYGTATKAMSYNITSGGELVQVLAPTTAISTTSLAGLTCLATNNVLTIYFEVVHTYPSATRSDYIQSVTVTSTGTVGTPATVLRGVGLASKAVYYNNTAYMLVSYGGSFQPSYFLIKGTGEVVARLAYSNGAGYYTGYTLPTAYVVGTTIKVGYLYRDLITPVNKTTANSKDGIYSQTGINLATFDFNTQMGTAEIGNNLHLTGGQLWMYDGNTPVEHNFHVFPEDFTGAISSSTGSLGVQQYYYAVTYEWTDAQGNIHRSAPSVPLGVNLTGGNNTITLTIPTLRLTAKTGNKVRIVVYRWSTAQPIYYQVTNQTSTTGTNPLTLNDTTVDTVTFVDKLADSSIIGNQILYTTGGVVENIAPPASTAITLYKSRVFLIDAEDPDLLWFSKQVIENTPAEFSDLFTQYIAPTTGAQGSTGKSKCLAPMDDKLIIFKSDAMYYIVGVGPDIAGNGNDFSDPIFISGTVGCANPQSIVLTPDGLMFQSDKGIWLLGRDLSTSYIGAPVESYTTGATVLSAISIPGTNQIRFTLSSGVTLMYDYYFARWATFNNIPAISSVLYQGLHTFINESGQVYQETPGLYLDGTNPVLMSFTTAWLQLAGLQGYQRAYFFYLLATYMTPHKLQLELAYDYDGTTRQTVMISPDNYNPTFGNEGGVFGDGDVFGGNTSIEQWRVFLSQQRCQSLRLTLSEVYDPSLSVPAGAGFTMSGLTFVIGAKKGFVPIKASRSVG